MIKVNEIKIMEMINNNDMFGIQQYIENEIIMQKTTDKSELKKIKEKGRQDEPRISEQKNKNPVA